MRYGDVRHSGVFCTLTVPHTLEKGYINGFRPTRYPARYSSPESVVRVKGFVRKDFWGILSQQSR
jgi:hypothetical protein